VCRGKGRGCYVQSGWTQRAARILDRKADGMTGDQVIEKEVALIDSVFLDGVPQDGARGGRDLRLHIGGDTSSQRATLRLAGTASRWLERGGGSVWAYTHRWREIEADSWGKINVLASVETIPEADLAWRRGYAVAITVLDFKQEGRYEAKGKSQSIKILPCPAQVRGQTCVQCRLCLGKLKGRVAVGFSLHGTQVKAAKKVLHDLEQTSFEGI